LWEISTADTQITLGKFDDAIASLQSALSQMAEDSPTQSLATVNLAKAYAGLGKMEQARSYCRQTDCEPVVPVMKKWRIVRRTILDMELHKYARTSVVPQALILHGPCGVGKRTTVEG
jgi:lipopolysaccharide biosynthesis regulator YciM